MGKDVFINMKSKKKLQDEGKMVYPEIIDIHPVMNMCNLKCSWCIGEHDVTKKQKKNQILLDYHKYTDFFTSIFNDDMREFWPTEAHICGNNSEPLLNRDFIANFLEISYRKTIIELITNGVLLHNYFELTDKIDKISISLDCFSAEDFVKYKSGTKEQFAKIIENIKTIDNLRKSSAKRTILYVTFVLGYVPSIEEVGIESFIEMLVDFGVNHIQFRTNYILKSSNYEDYLKSLVTRLRAKFGISHDAVIYNNDNINQLYIKYNEYTSRAISLSSTCGCTMMPLWPTIAANMCMYPCAHVANEENKINGISIMETKLDYYQLFDYIKKREYTPVCSEVNLCPSMAYYFNNSYIREKI